MDAASRPAASTLNPALLARIVKGDQQAFSQLYDQSSSLLYTLAIRILGHREEAAELLQEVYLEVWRKVARYDVGRGTPIAWLVTLTRSRAIDRLRSRASKGLPKMAASLDSPAAAQVPDHAPSPFESHADTELKTLITSALAELPTPQQEAIEMAYYEGLSHAEIAACINQPLGTVKTRIKLGLTKLRTSLRGTWEQGELL
jgi:RNA polymerase sigma-70 factor (ECF subfamily)